MQEPYRVIDVEEAIDWEGMPNLESPVDEEPIGVEHMGSSKKFWYRDRECARWLFKYPRDNSGEHWAEKIAAEVAGRLEIPHGSVELAVFGGSQGSVTNSFVRDDWDLIHGNRVLETTIPTYNRQAMRRQPYYTLENILLALKRTFIGDDAVEKTKRQFAEYVVMDAVIGNTDRHHENWGILRTWTDEGWRGRLAPTFDHASSLGRELLDEKRTMRLREKSIGHYAERGARGKGRGVYWSILNKYPPSPLELVRLAARGEPDLFRPAVSRLEKLDVDSLRELVNRVPDGWMTPAAREFAVALMRYNIETMREMM